MLALVGQMLEQSNYKNQALIALRSLPAAERSPVTDSLLAVNQSWLAQATSFFLNVSIWLLFAVIAYLLFAWRGDAERRLS